VPTLERRSQVTHTPEIREAIEIGTRHWPALTDRPAAMIAKLAVYGARQLENEPEPPLAVVPTAGRVISLNAIDEEIAYGI